MTRAEDFWKGVEGNAYTLRNQVDWLARVRFWEIVLRRTGARNVLDCGCNCGWNLLAIEVAAKNLGYHVDGAGFDINAGAVAKARASGLNVVRASMADLETSPARYDLVCTSGVLIHVPPSQIKAAMQSIVTASHRWVLAVEYSASVEKEIEYRGNAELLWKRPYGMLYRKLGLRENLSGAPAEGYDRCTYWIMEK